MSQFINGSFGLPVTIHAASNISNCDQIYFGLKKRATVPELYSTELPVRSDNAYYNYTFAGRWWPRGGSSIVGGWSGSGDDVFQNLPQRWIAPNIRRGCNGRLGFVGYTRDQYGSALGGCTVRCYRASTEEQVCKVTSDANGLYFATTPYNDAHFLVIHNAAGDQAGATANTQLPA